MLFSNTAVIVGPASDPAGTYSVQCMSDPDSSLPPPPPPLTGTTDPFMTRLLGGAGIRGQADAAVAIGRIAAAGAVLDYADVDENVFTFEMLWVAAGGESIGTYSGEQMCHN